VALVSIATLAVGIGGSAAIFSVVNAVLLRPLAYRDAGELVAIFAHETRRAEPRNPTSPADFTEWKRSSQVLDLMTAAHPWSPVLNGRGRPEELPALKASPSLFDLLGVEPALGRVFHTADEPPQVVLSHALWQRRFGGDPGIVGQSLDLDGRSYVIAGVMPPGFRFPPFWATAAELWAPLVFDAAEEARHRRYLRVFARLRPGRKLEEARAELDVVAARLQAEWPEENAGVAVHVEALREPVVGDVRPALLMLAGAVAFVLLIAGANVTSLLLAQGLSRSKELAIRGALGASRGRLVMQWVGESLVLAMAGGVGGLALARAGVAVLRALGPTGLPRLQEISVDGRVVAFTLVLALATGLLVGLLPALRASRADLVDSLKQGDRGSSGPARHRAHDVLVVGEVALAVMLLVGAGLLMKSFLRLQRPEPGFRADGLLTVTLSLSGSPWAEPARRPAFFRELVDRVRALPAVEGAGLVNHVPIAGDTWRSPLTVEGQPLPAPGDLPVAVLRTVSPDYLATMGIPLLRGRPFEERDGPDSTRVVLVNQALVRRCLSEVDPLGARVRMGTDADSPWLTVVGVTGDARQGSLTEPVAPELIFPYAQDPVGWFKGTTLVVRSAKPPRAIADVVQAQIAAVGPELPITAVRTMPEILADAVAQDRLNTFLLGVLAVVALLLAAVGIYGVMAYTVGRRVHEIGVRMALGARATVVFAAVIGQGLRLSLLGAGLGLAGALGLARLLAGLLHDVSTTDPWTFAAVIALLVGVSALASFLPARRAAGVDPLVALREG
jgi:putative ABC transport system permease protein